MNDLSSRFRSGDDHRPLTRRAQAKLQTRDRVLQAAKRLFISRGYEAATIRDIAQEAGMSTGAVFANFTDKNHLFHEVIHADMAAQAEHLAAYKDHEGPIEAAIGGLFGWGYEVNLEQLPLIQAATSLSWGHGLDGVAGDRPQGAKVVQVLCEMIRRAVERGELDAPADTRMIAEMLWDVYVANYRLAVFGDWDVAKLKARIAAQTDIILAGVRRTV